MIDKKILLVAINSKYIHSNLAVFCLKSAAVPYDNNITIKEYSINNQFDDILRGIYEEKPDVIGFSCYIWNIEIVKDLISELSKIMPDVHIWLGGPEVSYNSVEYLEKYPFIKGVMKGEGEAVFQKLIACYIEEREEEISEIYGITTRVFSGVQDNPLMPPIELSNSLPYDTDSLKNRIIYYESSRGCPFSCSYCLSSVDKKLRFKSLDAVKKDLQLFIDNEVPQVKFVDRTFNCKKEHAYAIWRYIKENDRGITNFHFEIAADLLDEEGIAILNSMRPGLVQLEIGVQSTNENTIKAIHRNMNLDKVKASVKAIKLQGNIHVHLDLIAGLPFEDFESFKKSFNDIYAMEPEQLQLGFLKLLHGSLMRSEKDKYGIVAREKPPYEVLYTNWLTYDEILSLKLVENVVEMFYNSGMFKASLKYVENCFDNPFDMYMLLGNFYDCKYPSGSLPSRNAKYELMFDFSMKYGVVEPEVLTELLKFDMLCRDNLKSLPNFITPDYETAVRARKLLGDRKMTKAEHAEIFSVDVLDYLESGIIHRGEYPLHFDYLQRDRLTNNAVITRITEMEN